MKIKLLFRLRRLSHQLLSIGVLAYILPVSNAALATKTAVINHGTPSVLIAVDLNRDGKIGDDIKQIKLEDIAAGKKANDATTPALPYRFWTNSDLDVVNHRGDILWNEVNCDKYNTYSSDEYKQKCEQWDEDPAKAGRSNTSSTQLSRIESYRDLEDFAPILFRLSKGIDLDEYTITLKASGANINLFKSDWSDEGASNVAHKYIFDEATTKSQIELANSPKGHFPIILFDRVNTKLTEDILKEYFNYDTTGEGRFIFEAIAPSPEGCATNATNCYIELEITKNNDDTFKKQISRVYLDIHNIQDYYDLVKAGPSAQEAGAEYIIDDEYGEGVLQAFHAAYNDDPVQTVNPKKLNLYDGLFKQQDINKDYVLQVHGWRMLDAEKTNFSETSFKRLYWSGYKGQMGALHWPTGWFDKPAHAYGIGVLAYVLGNERNYNISEAVARRVGKNLRNWLISNPKNNMHLIAHSMGNVVVSEALKYDGEGSIITSYTASQAAESSGAYSSQAADILHELTLPSWLICPFNGGSTQDPVNAWRCYNIDNELSVDDTPFDMPPDMWRYDFVKRDTNGNPVDTNGVPVSDGNYVIEHGSTERVMGSNPDGNHHYKDIALHVDRILNFYNAEDLALTAWEFNQLTKPDSAQGIDWFYTNSYRMAYSEYETCLFYNSDATNPAEYCTDKFPEIPESVIAQFELGGEIVPYNDANAFDILAHAIPARTEPLGQVITLGEITSNSNFDGFTDSNQDHSAPFHGYYSEISLHSGTRERASYWNTVLVNSLELEKGLSTDFTGLKNQIQSR